MSKKVKALVAMLVAVVLLTVGGIATVMAQEETSLPQEASTANTTSPDGLLARVADVLGISHEELVDAFEEAQQELMQEAFARSLDEYLQEAVDEGLITPDEATEIMEWWDNGPEALNRLFTHSGAFPAIRGRQMMPVPGKISREGPFAEEQANSIRERWQNRQEVQKRLHLRPRISEAIRNRQQISIPKGW
ncbi:hypothetical protein ACFLTG_02800 [Chloroflexota bacterium]